MSQSDLIITSFKTRLLADAALAALLPGDLHHGERVDTETTRPYALMVANETERESASGNTALVSYEVILTIVAEQSVGDVGTIIRAFKSAFDLTQDLPDCTGSVVMVYPLTSGIIEDKDLEYGRDILLGRITWEVQISETE